MRISARRTRHLLVALVLLPGLVVPFPVRAQDQVAPAEDPTPATVDTMATVVADTQAVPSPNPVALELEPEVDLWDTGVSPTAAVLMTPVFPGWGQLYAENSWRGALSFGIELFYWTKMLSADRRAVRARDFARNFEADDPNYTFYNNVAEENWEQMRDWAWWSAGVLLIIALDAYVGAHLFQFDEDPVPVPDRWDEQFGVAGGDMPGTRQPLTVTVFQWRKTF